MNLEGIGAVLKTEREKRHLSIDNVAGQLKINPRLLGALEAGDASALPHQAYVRGFIRSYAALLGMNQEEIQGLLDGAGPVVARGAEVSQAAASAEESDRPGKSGGRRAFAIILLLCALGGGGWWAWGNGYFSFLPVKKNEPATLDQQLPAADAYLAARDAERDAAEAKNAEAGRAMPEPAPADVALPPERAEAPKTGAAAAEPAPEAAPAQPAQEGGDAQDGPAQHKLIITATEECWVHSSADKTDTRQFSLRKGDTFALRFSKSLELKFGNAGGVRLRYDGRDLPPPGTSGQVKTVVFPPKDDAEGR